MNDEKYIERFKRNIYKKYPEELKRLHEFNQHFTEIKEPKGYCLSKVKNKKTGFVYYDAIQAYLHAGQPILI